MISVIDFSLNGCPSRLRLLLEGECMNQKAKPHKPTLILSRGTKWHMGFGFVPFSLGGVRVQRRGQYDCI